ncbi:MAG: carboxypeptidase regulatory-like domain-containing protein [Actinomycetota bacterium]
MRRLAPATAALVLAAMSPAAGAATGAITGRVVNATTDKPEPGVRVTLVSGTEAGTETFRRTATTDRHGRYRFEDLPTGEDRFYALDARYDGGLFSGRALSIPADTAEPPVIDSILRVWPTTTNPASVSIARDDLFVGLGKGGAGVIESVIVVNASERAYIGRGADDDPSGSNASLGFALPDGAEGAGVGVVDSDIDVPEIVPADFGFAVTVAIPPGETHVTFAYTVRGTGGSYDLSRVALYSIADYNVHVTEPLEVSSNRLEDGGEVTVPGSGRYRKWSAAAIEAGDPIQVIAVARGENNAWLVAGIVGAVMIAVVGLVFTLVRRRGSSSHSEQTESRDDLVVEIARLDLRYRAGEMSEEEWTAEREGLKKRLETSERA